jgi:monofunctional biosynthetic peptidoglycan transglycosylase
LKPKKKRILRIRHFLMILATMSLISIALIFPSAQPVIVGITCIILLSLAITLPWRWINPPTTAFILREPLNKNGITHHWVDLQNVSLALQATIIFAEDRAFSRHHGFDFKAIKIALEQKGQKRPGASTISQQLVKNLYLWPGRTLFRKAIEAYLTIYIEMTWPKRRILEVYLNMIEYGPQLYGIDAACRQFFGKEPSQITIREAALLATVLPAPKHRSVLAPSPRMQALALHIEKRTRKRGARLLAPILPPKNRKFRFSESD